MSAIEIAAIGESEKPALWNFLQAYIAELSAYDPAITPVDGVYHYPWFDAYWRDADRWPFWVKVYGAAAGFALLRRTSDGTMEMAEFYVLPEYRRTGAGIASARDLIARFAGPWSISQYQANAGSVVFWRRVIEGRSYAEREYISENGNPRIEQRFTV